MPVRRVSIGKGRGCDSRGNYSMGLTEQTIFPEIDPDSVKQVQGMNITIVTTARTDGHCKELLALLRSQTNLRVVPAPGGR